MINIIKKIVKKIPYTIGSKLALVPFSYRLGKDYSLYSKKIIDFNNFSDSEKEKFIIKRFSKIFEFSKINFPFYKELYKKNNVYDLKIKSINDIKKVPIISKKLIRNNLSDFSGNLKLNTGGSSGEPFSFYVDKNAFAREWAHMHDIWSSKNYNYKNLKITLRGENLGKQNFLYNSIHNEFIINTYKSVKLFKNEFMNLMRKKDIRFIHGYPSAIYNFLRQLEIEVSKEEMIFLKKKIKACFLGSEFPTPVIKKYLSNIWEFEYVSWYGHSEMCILAQEKFENKYFPYQTYGYCEVIENKLIGTSYNNFDMPLIRYDTGDIVKAQFSNSGIINYFTVTNGRVGEFITDNDGVKIPLTALIFGRHHKAFEYFDFIQVEQNESSKKVTFYLTSNSKNIIYNDSLLNISNVNIDYNVVIIKSPLKTISGKVNLKISSQ